MVIKLTFEEEASIKRVSYCVPKSIFGYIYGILFLVIVELILNYGLSSQYPAFQGVPLYFTIMLIILITLNTIPYRVNLEYNKKDNSIRVKSFGFFFYSSGKIRPELYKIVERTPSWYIPVIRFNFKASGPFAHQFMTREQSKEIADYFNMKLSWVENGLGTNHKLGIPLSEK